MKKYKFQQKAIKNYYENRDQIMVHMHAEASDEVVVGRDPTPV